MFNRLHILTVIVALSTVACTANEEVRRYPHRYHPNYTPTTDDNVRRYPARKAKPVGYRNAPSSGYASGPAGEYKGATHPRVSPKEANGKVDAIPSPVNGKVKVSTPYTVLGETYYPLATGDGYTEVGVASWYGPTFHEKLTGNGEVYNQRAKTCAHLTLPFNRYVKVENLENGKSTIVRVNDRGPFAKDRIIDLSEKAAEEIGMVKKGTARVRLTALPIEGERTMAAKPAESGGDRRLASFKESYYVQAGAFAVEDSANMVLEKLPNRYKSKGRISETDGENGTLHRVLIGPFRNKAAAARAETDIRLYTGHTKVILAKQ